MSEDLEADARRLGEAGLEIDGPDEGGRCLPDGGEVLWRNARVRQEERVLPCLVEDTRPHGIRVPDGPATEHQNGATGTPGASTSSVMPRAPQVPSVTFASGRCASSTKPGLNTRARC